MKKVFSLLAVLALVCMASSAWAAQVLPTGSKTAYAEFTAEDINITVDLYELPATYSTNFYQSGTPTSATQIEFKIDTSEFSFGSATAYNANGNVFAKIKTNLASVGDNKKLFMYTDNMNNSSGYKVYGNGNRRTQNWDGTEVKLCNGLIRKDGKVTTDPGSTASDFSNDGDYAPIKMQFIKAVDADATGKQYSKANYPDVFNNDEWNNKGLKDLLDVNDTTLSGGAGSLRANTIIGKSGAGGGIWVGQSWYSGNDDVIVFFGASFDHIVGGDKYMTNTIKFEYAAE